MGIKLDWQVESEQSEVRASEDPEARRRRRTARRRFALVIVALASLLCLVAALVIWRLQQVDEQYTQDLRDTVEAEVAALRVGDFDAFMAIQRSKSSPFLVEQASEFERYQQLKQTHRVQLTGNVLDVATDDLTGRVVVEEVIDGVAYQVVWFYWYYEDDDSGEPSGWRRVPDNLQFWGEPGTESTAHVAIDYQSLDAPLAKALAPRAEDWWTRGCALMGCAEPPPTLHIEIAPRPGGVVEWAEDDPWMLRVPSPLVARARADVPLAPDLEQAIRGQIASRVVTYALGGEEPPLYSDARWVSDELARWLENRLVAGDAAPAPDPTLIGQLVAQFGPETIAALRGVMGPETPIDTFIQAASGVSLSQLSVEQLGQLDWRGFFEWRLALESLLLSDPASSGRFLALYDLERADAATTANARLGNPAAAQSVPQVTAAAITHDDSGQTFAVVELLRDRDGQQVQETAFWRLAGGTWKRVT